MKLTVFTPTYNRAYCLHVCYESLRRQTVKDFVWLIVDDGSTDRTKELVERWAAAGDIQIRYVWQQNQGMHGAHNKAYELIDTELNVCIDSDDCMPDDAVEKIIACWNRYGSVQVGGIIGLDAYIGNRRVIGSMLPEQLHTSTLFDLYNKHRVTGDKKLVYRTELAKQYPYPLFPGEKYVGLAYKYYKLDQICPMLLLNEVLCCVEYLPDGSSRNMLKQYRRNPRGFVFYRKELMRLPFADAAFKFRQAVHFVSSSLLAGNRRFLSETPCKLLTVLASPLGFALFGYIRWRTRGQTG